MTTERNSPAECRRDKPRQPYQAPEAHALDLKLERSLLSGMEGEPVGWDEDLVL